MVTQLKSTQLNASLSHLQRPTLQRQGACTCSLPTAHCSLLALSSQESENEARLSISPSPSPSHSHRAAPAAWAQCSPIGALFDLRRLSLSLSRHSAPQPLAPAAGQLSSTRHRRPSLRASATSHWAARSPRYTRRTPPGPPRACPPRCPTRRRRWCAGP